MVAEMLMVVVLHAESEPRTAYGKPACLHFLATLA